MRDVEEALTAFAKDALEGRKTKDIQLELYVRVLELNLLLHGLCSLCGVTPGLALEAGQRAAQAEQDTNNHPIEE
jgi:hypothetical protein